MTIAEKSFTQRTPYGYQLMGQEIYSIANKYGREIVGLNALRGKSMQPVLYGATPDQDQLNKRLIDSIETTTERQFARELREEAARANNEQGERDDKKRGPSWFRW